MNSGSMRHIVEVQRSAEIQDEMGGVIFNWSTRLTRNAFVQPISGSKEQVVAKQISALVSHIVTMRYMRDLLPTDRFLYKNRILNITAISNTDERNKELICFCIEHKGEV
jgi:SPP1 family predicted phage head-tail adaptor